MITKEELKNYAHNLMFDMKEEEYETLIEEFENMERLMSNVATIPNIKEVEPTTFPFQEEASLREDIENIDGTVINKEDVLKNAKDVLYEQVKVPKVVE